ncbi:MAG: hypothetical protein GXC94_20110 [Comamonadaceae bacterium]|jgi:hypothetical protein|nr:hypothetical protein [Comamonadaceae bacterium]
MQPFFKRLRAYFETVAAVLRGEADAAAMFPNSSNVGAARERIYAEFLRQHAPSKCNVLLGGFLFDEDGAESKQLDIIVTTDTAPQFNFHNRDGAGPSFSPVEGTLAVVSVKSTLDKAQLHDALQGLASIPATRPLGTRVNPNLRISGYEDWPLKVVYASRGIAANTLLEHLNAFYREHPEIPPTRRVDFIHVAGNCFIVKLREGMQVMDRATGQLADQPPLGAYQLFNLHPDMSALIWMVEELQTRASAATHILFKYNGLLASMHELTE